MQAYLKFSEYLVRIAVLWLFLNRTVYLGTYTNTTCMP
jgi:hypothetical protein